MQGYWPAVLDDPNASAHGRTHARWYASVKKIVASRTLPATRTDALTIAGDDIIAGRGEHKDREDVLVVLAGADAQKRAGGVGDVLDLQDLALEHGRLPGEAIRVPLEQAERIEVVDGTGSSLYGNYALGGVINIVSPPAASRALEARVQYGSLNSGAYDVMGSFTRGAVGLTVDGGLVRAVM